MNTPARTDDELRCAEYALGVLDTDARRALERDIEGNPQLRATLDRWLERLAPLAEDLPSTPPPARVWRRIERDLGVVRPATSATEVPRWWSKLALWRWMTAGASVAALTLLALNLVVLRETRWSSTQVARNGYMVATIVSSDGVAHWVATVDERHARMVIVTAARSQVAANQSAQLWFIAPGAKPISLGLLPAMGAASVPVPTTLLGRLNTASTLAVSVEPAGGSPTGQPTGPVIATGAMHGV